MARRLVVIGLDGVSYDLLRDLAERGIMPRTAQLIKKGFFKKISSTIPALSSVAWSSIITGSNPGEHGIFGFTDFKDNSTALCFPNFSDIRMPAFWERSKKRFVILNVPSTYPVKTLNGVHISGFVSPDITKSVYPKTLLPALKSLDYRLDVDSSKAHRSMDSFLEDVQATTESLAKVYAYLWETCPWEIFMVVFTTTDRLMHFLYDAYEHPGHTYHAAFLGHFKAIDGYIGDILSRLAPDDRLLLLSDHGFERLETAVSVNELLEDLSPVRQAVALDPARIYINTTDRFFDGTVSPSDREKVRDSLADMLRSKKVNGKTVIKKICVKEALYHGPCLKNAPDLVLVGEKGVQFNARSGEGSGRERSPFSGKHTEDNAFVLSGGAYTDGMDTIINSVEDTGKLIAALSAD
ncbi:MAG: alkaline phosphatase family protein [Candidatus Omnitrophica bacterium]|nr:alkaline phosphatase family protein [Candidatus Omnitrophota bacterium]